MAGNANSAMGRLLTFIGDELNLAISQINEVFSKVIKRGNFPLNIKREDIIIHFFLNFSLSFKSYIA